MRAALRNGRSFDDFPVESRTEDARSLEVTYLTSRIKRRLARTAKGRLTGPALSSSACTSRMHRCHCRLNYFGFLFSTADGRDDAELLELETHRPRPTRHPDKLFRP